jgi:ACS family glucarate transporter-like MFS transporter
MKKGNKRWIIAVLLLGLLSINYIDRVNLSVATPVLQETFNLTAGQMGILQSLFLVTYVILVIPMGLMVDRLGAHKMTVLSLVVWSLAAVLTGFANGLVMLVVLRLLLGVGESPVFPTCNKVVSEWAPAQERGLMTSFFNSGTLLGPAIGIIAASYLIQHFSWQFSFIALGSLGFIWIFIWLWLYNTPEKAWWLGDSERKYILDNRQSVEKSDKVKQMSVGMLLRQKTMWGLLLSHGGTTYAMYFFLTWMPAYLATQRHLNLVQAGWYGALPYLIAMIATIGLSKVSDYFGRKQDLSTGARRKLIILYMLLGSIILLVPYIDNFLAMEILLIVSNSFFMAANTLNFALLNDLTVDKSSAGATTSLMVFGGSASSFFAPIVTGFIIQFTHSYTSAFVLSGFLLILGAAISWFMVRKPLQPAE